MPEHCVTLEERLMIEAWDGACLCFLCTWLLSFQVELEQPWRNLQQHPRCAPTRDAADGQASLEQPQHLIPPHLLVSRLRVPLLICPRPDTSALF